MVCRLSYHGSRMTRSQQPPRCDSPTNENYYMETNVQQSQNRPTGMTVLLVLSSINACWNILRSIIMYFATPRMAEMYENGQFEEMMQPFSAMGEDFIKAMNDSMHILTQVNPNYYLILLVLFIASLVGVVRMFKGDKRGFHIYSIAQICMLIAHSVFMYPLQKPSPFVSDLLLTTIFILLYYLYFKRMKLSQNPQDID